MATKIWRPIKWSYATNVLRDLPSSEEQLGLRSCPPHEPPLAGDVVVTEVLALGRHLRIELTSKRSTALFPGQLVGVAYGRRYATTQYEGTIPEAGGICDLLSVGGVCGRVVGMADRMVPPTTLRPLGYLLDGGGHRVRLEAHGLARVTPTPPRPCTILVVGSSMDSGKTTTLSSLANGLVRAGATVAAAKLTGTAAAKDVALMEDGGASPVLDFTHAGHPSTAGCTPEQLSNIVAVLSSNLAAHRPDFVLYEIADGITQRETKLLLELLKADSAVDHVVYACSDAMGAVAGARRLWERGLPLTAVSGRVTMSPEIVQETQLALEVPVLRIEDLRAPQVVQLFRTGAAQPGEEAQDALRA